MTQIQLIAGHGAGDPGATAKHNGVSYEEAVEARTLVERIALALQNYDAQTRVYPTAQNAFRDLKRGDLALSGDFVLEVHFNAVRHDAGDGKRKGTEVLLAPNARSAAAPIAEKLCAAVAETLGVPNRGVKTQSLAVMHAAGERGIPSALLEVCFLDDADDWSAYLPARERVACAVAEALAAALGVQPKPKDCSPWAQDACRWAVEQGIFQGDARGDYHWQSPVTREQLATVLQRALNGFPLRGEAVSVAD